MLVLDVCRRQINFHFLFWVYYYRDNEPVVFFFSSPRFSFDLIRPFYPFFLNRKILCMRGYYILTLISFNLFHIYRLKREHATCKLLWNTSDWILITVDNVRENRCDLLKWQSEWKYCGKATILYNLRLYYINFIFFYLVYTNFICTNITW